MKRIISRLKRIYQKYLENKSKKKYEKGETVIVSDKVCCKGNTEVPIVFGVVGTGHVSDRWIHDIKMLPAECNISVKGIFDANTAVAEKKAKQYGNLSVYETYEAMLSDSEINAVYVATPNVLHCAHTVQALRAGKNVICEKPVAVNTQELQCMKETARENGCFFMEGMWMRTLPMIKKLCEVISSGEIGSVRYIETRCMNSNSPEKYPSMFSKQKAGGALMDVGCYGLHFAELIMGKAEEISSFADITEGGVDLTSSVVLVKDGITASVTQSLGATGGAFATIHAEKGYVEVPMFLSPSEFTVKTWAKKTVYKYSVPKEKRTIGYAYEIAEFADCIRNGYSDSALIPYEDTYYVSSVMEKVRKNHSLIYGSEINDKG